MSNARISTLAVGLSLAAVLIAGPATTIAAVVAPATVRTFGVWRGDANGQLDTHNPETFVACITNMLQWLSAGTSYGSKQYDQEPGSDLSANPNSSDGLLLDGTGNTTHQTWLTPEANTLQFWFGWSRLDHDTTNVEFANAAKGFNFNIIMNEDSRYWDPVLGKVVRVPSPPGTPIHNNVQMDISVKGSLLTPSIILADEYSTDPADYPAAPYTKELPRIITSTSELQYATPDAGWDQAFAGDWNYREFSTDGGVIGDLLPDENNPGSFVIRIVLNRLYDEQLGKENDPNGIKKIVFYSFEPTGIYDPFDPASYAQGGFVKYEFDVSMFNNGDVLYFTDCCDPVPEPVTLALLAGGGAIVGGLGVARSRRGRRAA